MKNLLFLLLALIVMPSFGQTKTKWKLVWQDNFDGTQLDTTKWSKIPRNTSDWGRYLTSSDSCYIIKDGTISLIGRNNTILPTDTARFLTGGIHTKDIYSIKYGKVEICAKLGGAQGAWPAMWMLPQGPREFKANNYGEIDIIEHLNHDDFVYQTVHSHYTLRLGLKDDPKNYGTAKFDPNVYNVFGLEWYPDKLVFTVNGTPTFTYPKIETDKEGQWPFDEPYFLMIDQQLGGSWVGAVDPKELPIAMQVDYVKMYQAK